MYIAGDLLNVNYRQAGEKVFQLLGKLNFKVHVVYTQKNI